MMRRFVSAKSFLLVLGLAALTAFGQVRTFWERESVQ